MCSLPSRGDPTSLAQLLLLPELDFELQPELDRSSASKALKSGVDAHLNLTKEPVDCDWNKINIKGSVSVQSANGGETDKRVHTLAAKKEGQETYLIPL